MTRPRDRLVRGWRDLREGGPLAERLPISFRLGLSFAGLFLVALTCVGALGYWGLGQVLVQEIDRSLVSAAGELNERPITSEELDGREFAGVEAAELESQVIGADGSILAATDDDLEDEVVLAADQIGAVRGGDAVFADVLVDEDAHRVLAVPFENNPGQVLVVLAELDTVTDAEAALLRIAGPLALLGAVIAGLAGWFVARRGLRPIATMTAEADRIHAHDLSRRLPTPTSPDEVGRLGRTLNAMLARIEQARRRERDFTANASHELRTPLAILRTELELATIKTGDPSVKASLDSAIEECDNLARLVDDLLTLARADAGGSGPPRPTDLGPLADVLLQRFGVLADRRKVRLSRTGDAVVVGDPIAIGRAMSNLLDNAIRHSPDGGHVDLAIDPEPQGALVTVTDEGPGIPPEHRERVLERFAQHQTADGSNGAAGLGLSIAAAVATAHRGTLSVDSGPGGRGLSARLLLREDARPHPGVPAGVRSQPPS